MLMRGIGFVPCVRFLFVGQVTTIQLVEKLSLSLQTDETSMLTRDSCTVFRFMWSVCIHNCTRQQQEFTDIFKMYVTKCFTKAAKIKKRNQNTF